MKKFLLWGILALTIASATHAQTGVYVPQLASFDNAMLNLMSTYNVPGAQLAITRQGRLVYNRGFGFADTATRDSVYPHSIFRVASVSKTITAVACMKLFEQGLLILDARVFGSNGILNDEIYKNIIDPKDTLITVRMLLHHSGGWNRNISGDPMFNAWNIASTMGVPAPPSPEDVIRYVLENKYLDYTPGTQSHYSNFGYCVLGRVIEKITGLTYENYVRSNIFLPLELQIFSGEKICLLTGYPMRLIIMIIREHHRLFLFITIQLRFPGLMGDSTWSLWMHMADGLLRLKIY